METRMNCPRCGDTKERLYIRKVNGGYVRHCHNENCFKNDAFVKEDITAPSETAKKVLGALKGDNKIVFMKDIRLPIDYSTQNIPFEGMAWLKRYTITDEEIKRYAIGYSELYKRLILPVFDSETLVYWQGRNLMVPTKEHPKYLNIRQSGAKNIFFKGRCTNPHKPDEIVIVEDILSAIRCSRYIHSLALLGSYFPSGIYNILKTYKKIYIYLDDDKYHTAVDAAKKLHTILNIPIRIIKSNLDPKENNDLKELFYA